MKYYKCNPGDILVHKINPKNQWRIIDGTPGHYNCECMAYENRSYKPGQISRWEGATSVFDHIKSKPNNFKSLYNKLSSMT